MANTVVRVMHKKGKRKFTRPGLCKVAAIQEPATRKRFGKNSPTT